MLHGIELKGSSPQPINETVCFVSEEFLFLRVIFCLLTSGRSLWYCLGIIRIIDFHHVELVCGQCTPYCFWNYIQNLNGREIHEPWEQGVWANRLLWCCRFSAVYQKICTCQHAIKLKSRKTWRHQGLISVDAHCCLVLYVLFFCCAIFNWGGL